jgi:hypothetical protein
MTAIRSSSSMLEKRRRKKCKRRRRIGGLRVVLRLHTGIRPVMALNHISIRVINNSFPPYSVLSHNFYFILSVSLVDALIF